MWLLQWARPDIGVANLVIFAVEREHVRLGPSLHNKVVRLIVLLSQSSGIDSIREVGIHRSADREARNKTPPADAVQHRELFGNAQWRVVQRKAVAQHDDGRVLGAPCQSGCSDVRAWHYAVGVVVVLVDADAVKTHLISKFELIEILVVELMRLVRLEQMAGHIHPDAAVLVLEVLRQEPVGHQVEPANFHLRPLSVRIQ